MATPSVILQGILQDNSIRTVEQLKKELINHTQTKITRHPAPPKVGMDTAVNNIQERHLLQISQLRLSDNQKFLIKKQLDMAIQQLVKTLNLAVKIKVISFLKAQFSKLKRRLRDRIKKRKQAAEEERERLAAMNKESKEQKHFREQKEEFEKMGGDQIWAKYVKIKKSLESHALLNSMKPDTLKIFISVYKAKQNPPIIITRPNVLMARSELYKNNKLPITFNALMTPKPKL